MKLGHRFFAIIAIASLLTGCSRGGTSTSQENFISGNGSVTFIKTLDRIAAPKLSGMTLSGENYRFKQGRLAVVNVWASWCSPCRAESPALVALSKKYSQVSFIGINTRDNPASAKAFERRFTIPYPSLIDDSVLFGFRNSLSANAIPVTVVIDKSGRVAARISGQITFASLGDLIERVSAE